MPFKTPLEAAIAHLIAQGKIKSSADVARDMNLKSRGTVSSYVTGSAKISPNFQTLFESTYNIRLKDFEDLAGGIIKNPDPMSQDYREKFYQLLEKNSKLEEKIEANSKTMEGNMIHLTDLILQGQDDIIQKIGNELSQRLEALEKSLVSSLKVAPGKKQVQKGKH